METVRAHLFIRGRVQGVFYRAFTRDLANRLGLDGWARNLPDGSVEVVFQGGRQQVERAVEECGKGPTGAAVQGVDLKWESSSPEPKGFEIRY
ncbi:MAG: acylphosphatase [Nitrospirae bacterium]|nr:acylphosphatase [Nitrospirota bacterium]